MMLPRADVLAVSPVSRPAATTNSEAAGDARQEAFQRALAGQLGKSLQGEVLTRLTDGSFIVRVAGTAARMMLPAGAEVGREMPLTLVALSPRPTFRVGNGVQAAAMSTEAAVPLPASAWLRAAPLVYTDGATPAPGIAGHASATAAAALPARHPISHAAALLARAALTPAAGAATLAGDSNPASLSAAGKALGSVLGAILSIDKPPTAVLASTPLVKAPGADPRQLESALRQAIDSSGLFYESHVAEWAAGKRTLTQLAREPQMARVQEAGVAPDTSPAPDGPPAPASGRLPAMDLATAQFINLQLTSHEQERVAWQGQLWPGQPLHWEIARDAPEQRGNGREPAQPGWQSQLRTRFPLLGAVNASVMLSGEQLHIRLEVDNEAAGKLLREHTGQLSVALEAAGTPLSSLAVQRAREDRDG